MSRARYLVAPEQMERPGPKHAAVESEEEEERLYQDAIVDEEGESPPGYSHPVKGNGIEMGANAFAVSVLTVSISFLY
jgi:hypothetical protein